jgi:hypothetical protein
VLPAEDVAPFCDAGSGQGGGDEEFLRKVKKVIAAASGPTIVKVGLRVQAAAMFP